MKYTLKKMFNNFKGLDKRSSDLVRAEEYATEANNVMFRDSGALTKRNGVKAVSDLTEATVGGAAYEGIYGTVVYKDELLVIDENLYRLKTDGTITITWDSTNTAFTAARYSIYSSNGKIKFKIEEDRVVGGTVDAVDFDLNDGVNNNSIKLSDLDNSINTSTNGGEYTVTISDNTHCAAFLDFARLVEIPSGGITIPFNYWYKIPYAGSGAPFENAFKRSNDPSNYTTLENASTAILDDNLYICTGYDHIMRYDGTNVARAGLPKIDIADVSGTNVNTDPGGTTLNKEMKITCKKKDTSNFYTQSYFTLYSGHNKKVNDDGVIEDKTKIWVWFKFNADDTAPVPVGYDHDIIVDCVSITDTAAGVATALRAALQAAPGATTSSYTSPAPDAWADYWTIGGTGADVTISWNTKGAIVGAEDVDTNFDFTEEGDTDHQEGTGLQGTYYYKFQYIYADMKTWDVSLTDPWEKCKIIEGPASDALKLETGSPYLPQLAIASGSQIGAPFDVALRKVNGEEEATVKPYKLRIWRTTRDVDEFSIYYLVSEQTTYTHEDVLSDESLRDKVELLVKDTVQYLPPKARYMTVWQDQLILAGKAPSVSDEDDVLLNAESDTVYYSDFLNPEAFDVGLSSFIISSGKQDEIRGMIALKNALYIFQKHSIHIVTGDLATNQIRVALLSRTSDIGCLSHHSIVEGKNEILFLSHKGVYAINQQGLMEKSAIIANEFKAKGLNFSKSVGFNWREKELYILIIPKETSDNDVLGTDVANSEVFVYNYFREAWVKWSNIDFTGGIAEYKDNIYFSSRSILAGNTRSHLYKFLQSGTYQDYVDHASAIPFSYKTNWEALGHPSVFKKYLRVKVHALDTDESFESNTYTLDTDIEKDYRPVALGTIPFDFSQTAGAGWGLAAWGTSTWGAVILQSVKSKLPSGKKKSIRLGFSNSKADENVLISGYELECVTPFQEAIKE